MKRFGLKILLFSLIVFVVSYLSIFLPDKGNEGNLLYAMKDKQAALEAAEGPRVITVGGSNVAFGINSQKMSVALDRPAVNMGVHAGLGLKYILDNLRPQIRKGDVVVVIPEYDHFWDKYPSLFYGEEVLLTMTLDVMPDDLEYVSAKQWSHLYRFLPTYIGKKYYYALKYMTSARTPKGQHVAYQRKNVNAQGDIVGHLEMSNFEFPVKVEKDREINMDVIKYLNDFYMDCHAAGAEVYLAMTSFEQKSYFKSSESIKKLEKAMNERLDMPMLAPPARYRFSKDLFFDTPEHLNGLGRDIRTDYLIQDLEKARASQVKPS